MNSLTGFEQPILTAIKVGLIILLSLYLLFAAIVVKQVRVMTETLQVGFESQVKTVAFVHLAFSFLVLLGCIFFL